MSEMSKIALPKSSEGRLQMVTELLYPVDDEGHALPPLITLEEAKALLNYEERGGGGERGV